VCLWNWYKSRRMKTILFLILALTLFIVRPISIAKEADTNSSLIQDILGKYSASAGVKAKLEKTDFKKTLGLKSTTSGEMLYANGKIYILFNGEKKSEVIYNGENLWIIEYPDIDFDPKGKRKVTEISGHKPALAQQIVGLFQEPIKFLKNFKIISQKTDGKIITVRFESKDKAIQNFEVEFNTYRKLIKSIQFTDDVQTETRIEFASTELLKKAPRGVFQYKRKKDDEVM
jgi:outer membrane lipoprotein-sorting protein